VNPPSLREAGAGPAVVCLHSSASSSGQWRALMEALAARFRVVAPDLYGAGKCAPWPHARPMRLDDELALLRPVFDAAGKRFHLVGHSFGGAVALKAALAHRGRLLSLVLFEPVLFSVLVAAAPGSAAAQEIVAVREDTTRLVGAGDLVAAARRFIDYWMGDGAWAATPPARQPALAAAMSSVIPEWHAAFDEPTALPALATIDTPTMLMTGTRSKASARAVTRLLATVLPRAQVVEVEGADHMAPLTQPGRINPLIERFLASHDAPGSATGATGFPTA
jgi:pimeloyl-ACP methyl ester carboxylesterase